MTSRSCQAMLVVFGIASLASADTVRLKSGQVVEGRLSADAYAISTPDQGNLIVPLVSQVSALR